MSNRSLEAIKNDHNGNTDDEDDDDEDEDYVPTTDTNAQSEDEEPNDDEEDDESEDIPVKSKKAKLLDTQVSLRQDKPDELNTKKIEETWSSFLNDVKTSSKKNYEESSKTTINTQKVMNEEKRLSSAASTTTYSSQVSGSKGGITKLLNKIKNPPKLSTLEKSRLDWQEFKKNENIEEDLNRHSKGKESYLEKRAFLERADFREYEIEKSLRTKERKLRETH